MPEIQHCRFQASRANAELERLALQGLKSLRMLVTMRPHVKALTVMGVTGLRDIITEGKVKPAAGMELGSGYWTIEADHVSNLRIFRQSTNAENG